MNDCEQLQIIFVPYLFKPTKQGVLGRPRYQAHHWVKTHTKPRTIEAMIEALPK
jgi:hypothetical protein